ncbi:hypothetical protein [Nitrospira sp. Nam74]
MANTDSTDLAPITSYHAMTVPMEHLRDALAANIGVGGINPMELDRLKIPSGGGLVWTVPTLAGDQMMKEVEGIILHFKDTRAYWPDAYGGQNNPPQCQSDDSITGVGDPGVACAVCRLAKQGSAPPKKPGEISRSQACKQMRALFLLRPTDVLPIIAVLPPTSIAPCRKHFTRVLGQGPIWEQVTALTLEADRNNDGLAYSKAAFRFVRKLTNEETARIIQLRAALMPMFTSHRAVQETDVIDAE